jgi:TolB-like protein
VRIALGMLEALEHLHRSGRIHGGLTPAHLCLDGTDVTLREAGSEAAGDAERAQRYQSPEQVRGEPSTRSADLFAAGAMLFEMVAGHPAFGGSSSDDVSRAVLRETTPVLGGSAVVAGIDQVIHRALAKKPEDRYRTAAAMANDLRHAWLAADVEAPAHVHLVPRLIVLPFRILRSDPDTDFLAFSLADAITSSLSGLRSLVVRSSLTAERFRAELLDLNAVGAQADVDMVLTGTLLRDGNELRVNAQLIQVSGGAVIWSQILQAPLGRVFELQDDLVWRVVGSLPVSPTAPEMRLLKHDIPATARAYECYLRANQLGVDPAQWTIARDLYQQCIEEDPRYAPAWAQLGRIHRLIGIYAGAEADEHFACAQEAFQRAFEINPDLPLAHNLYTQLEVEMGRAEDAVLRLTGCAGQRASDPQLYAGLVHACRYCGLFDAAVAAHHRARRLDPNIRTSVAHAYWMLGDYERAIDTDVERPPLTRALALISIGRDTEAVAQLRAMEALDVPAPVHYYIVALRAVLEGKRGEGLEATERILQNWQPIDPCGRFYVARHLANLGDAERALEHLHGAVESGFACYTVLARDPWLDGLRGRVELAAILQRAELRYLHARAAFLQAGGDRVIGLTLS